MVRWFQDQKTAAFHIQCHAADKAQKTKRSLANKRMKEKDRIFSIKKYIAFDWMMELTEKDLELIDKEFITDQFDTYESDLVYKVNTKKGSVYLLDKKRTREEWTENLSELLHRIREMETEDLNEWITWFSNVIRKLNEDIMYPIRWTRQAKGIA